MQWHPIFAHLLRPLVQDHFLVETGMPVGEAPRLADIVLLLRRTSDQPLPFRGCWRFLTTWNVFEFKGPTVDPRLRDLDLLVELGLGIDRRLNEERVREQRGLLPEREVSFWYLAHHLGRRFLAEARRKLGAVAVAAEGVWRCEVLQRVLYLVSIDRVPVEPDSVPMHLLNRESDEMGLAVGRVVVDQPGFWDLYGSWLMWNHPNLLQEIQRMARAKGIEPTLDLKPLVDLVGYQQVIDQMGGIPKLIQEVGAAKVIQEMGLDKVVEQLEPKQVLDLFSTNPAKRKELEEWFASRPHQPRQESPSQPKQAEGSGPGQAE
jgi:hypothetical protein